MTSGMPETLAARISALQALLAQRELDLAVLQFNTDLYYYTGSVQPNYLLVPRAGEPCLVARKSLTRIREEAPYLTLHTFESGPELTAILDQCGARAAKRIGFTLDVAPYASVQRFLKLCPGAEAVDISWDLRQLRMVKSTEELAIMARAGAIMAQVPNLARQHFTPGMTELELSAALEYALRLQGHDALIRCRREGMEMSGLGVCAGGRLALAGSKFEGICGGQGLSPAVPYGASRRPIEEGVPLLIDFAFVRDGYIVDQTRMACWGRPDDRVKRAYDDMVEIEHLVFDALRPGTPWQDVYQLALERATAMGYADTFMGHGTEQIRFIGHGVGLELDEPPFLAPKMPYPLAAGMTIAIEPKLAIPDLGVIGIEDTVAVTDGPPQRLTMAEQELIVLG